MALETVGIDTIDPVDGQRLQANCARIYDRLLGGKDHYRQDRAAADALCALAPSLTTTARAGRRFMARVARHVAAARGVRQYLDLGSGIPSWPDLHDVVQQEVSDPSVVYVDHDPMVAAHARAVLTTGGGALVECVQADLRRPGQVLSAPGVRRALDAGRPVAVTLLAVLHVVPDDEEVRHIVEAMMSPWPSGSVVAISTACSDGAPARARSIEAFGREHGLPVRFRTTAEIEGLFCGLPLLDPGVVPVHHWNGTYADRRLHDHQVMLSGGVATVP